jgi:hypothetical protein
VAVVALVVALIGTAVAAPLAAKRKPKHQTTVQYLTKNQVISLIKQNAALLRGPKGDPGTPASIPPLPAATPITNFFSGWSDYGESGNPAGFFKDALGIVHLTGSVKGTPASGYMFTLPAGYRTLGFFASGSSDGSTTGSACTIVLFTSGTAYADSGCNSKQIGLDGITYKPAA